MNDESRPKKAAPESAGEATTPMVPPLTPIPELPEITALIRAAREEHPRVLVICPSCFVACTYLADPPPEVCSTCDQPFGPEATREPAPGLPRFGDLAWRMLGWEDRRKWASVAVAAECWREHCSPQQVAADLRRQLEEEDRAVLARLRGASADVRAGLPDGWVKAPSHAEMVRRRAS